MGIQDGQNPKVIEGMLRNYLKASKREPKGEPAA
jgi:chemotaxis protein MotA